MERYRKLSALVRGANPADRQIEQIMESAPYDNLIFEPQWSEPNKLSFRMIFERDERVGIKVTPDLLFDIEMSFIGQLWWIDLEGVKVTLYKWLMER